MKLRSGTNLSVHVCCWSSEREPFFLKRSVLTPEQKASIPSPAGSLRNRCDMVINLNEAIDHFAFLVLTTDPAGLRERIMRGFGRHLKRWESMADTYTILDISRGSVCGIQFKYLVEFSMSYALEREVEDNIGDHTELIRNEWPAFYSCHCGGPDNDLYMTIGWEFQTECYHCYASSFEDRVLESRRTFISYASMIAEALVVEGVEIAEKARKFLSLKERCDMAASIGVSMRNNILLAPHCHFLMATRRAFNEMLGLDSQHDKGWEYVRSPRDPAPGNAGDEAGEETDFEGYGSSDSQATVEYSMPDHESNDEGEFPEAA